MFVGDIDVGLPHQLVEVRDRDLVTYQYTQQRFQHQDDGTPQLGLEALFHGKGQ